MARTLDHLVIAARNLDEGAAYVRDRLGVDMQAGGKHATMGTHNRVLALGGGAYLEVIAIDPQGATPSRPRWMSLDSPPTQALLESGPALLHWVERTADLEGEVSGLPDEVEIQSFERGPYRWRMALTPDGRLPGGGLRPTLIQWDGPRAGDALPDAGCRLLDRGAPGGGDARLATASGERTVPWRLPPE
jgi:hypothetical protein